MPSTIGALEPGCSCAPRQWDPRGIGAVRSRRRCAAAVGAERQPEGGEDGSPSALWQGYSRSFSAPPNVGPMNGGGVPGTLHSVPPARDPLSGPVLPRESLPPPDPRCKEAKAYPGNDEEEREPAPKLQVTHQSVFTSSKGARFQRPPVWPSLAEVRCKDSP